MGGSKESIDKNLVNDDEKYRREYENKHQSGEEAHGKFTVDGQSKGGRDARSSYTDAGNDPFNSRDYEHESDHGRGLDSSVDSRYADKLRDNRHQREKDEVKEKRYKTSSGSQDDYKTYERSLPSPNGINISRGRDDPAHTAATYAHQSYSTSYSNASASRKPHKEDYSAPKEKQTWWQWTTGAVSYKTTDPITALSKMQAANNELDKENKNLRKTISSYESQSRAIQNIQNERDAALNKAGRLEQENTRLQEVQQSQSSQIRMAQELMLKNKSVQGALADEDRTVRLKFKSLQATIRDWGRDWSHGDITKLRDLNKEEEAEIRNYLSKVIRFNDQGEFPEGMSSSEKIITRAPALVLSALLSHEICSSVFDQPFRLLQASTAEIGAEERRLLLPGNDTLDRVYLELSRYDEVKAQAWRRQILEILDPSVIKRETAALAQRDADRRRSRLASELAAEFLNSPATKLLRLGVTVSEERKRLKSLELIFSEALEMSSRLWKQPTILRCRFFSDLVVEPFKNGSEFMEAHPLHQLGVRGEDDESEVTRLDDHQIMMAISPAIIALGDSDGENYSQHRVWAKGIVWLEE